MKLEIDSEWELFGQNIVVHASVSIIVMARVNRRPKGWDRNEELR